MMQWVAEFLKSVPDSTYTLLMGAVLGGISWFVHRRSGEDLAPGTAINDLLQGAIAGVVALGVLRPADLMGQISTALVAGYSASAFLAKQVEALVSKVRDDATTSLLQTADAVKQANHTVNQHSLMATMSAPTKEAAASSQPTPTADHEINLVVTNYLDKIAQARTAKEVRVLQNQATLELKQKMPTAA